MTADDQMKPLDPATAPPSWDELQLLVDHSSLNKPARELATWSLRTLASGLGPEWLERMWRATGRIPAEMYDASTHAGVLPRLVTAALAVDHAVSDERFAHVLRSVRRAGELNEWHHFLVQAEVARAARAADDAFQLEPRTGLGRHKGDLLVRTPSAAVVVEVSTRGPTHRHKRALVDFGELSRTVTAVAEREQVTIELQLTAELEEAAVAEAFAQLEAAASRVATTGQPEQLHTLLFRARLRLTPPHGSIELTGFTPRDDAWYYIGLKLTDKADQLRPGPTATPEVHGAHRWIRVDVFTGLFTLTDWAQLPDEARLNWIAGLIRAQLADAPHIDGVVLSTGYTVDWNDPPTPPVDVAIDGACLIRLGLAPYAARESIIVATTDRGVRNSLHWWRTAYRGERDWMLADLQARSLLPDGQYTFPQPWCDDDRTGRP